MKPTETRPADHEPTLPGIARYLVRMGLDRGSLVWPAEGDHPNGVAVFMLRPAAIRALGPMLRDFAARYLKREAHSQLNFDSTTRVTNVMTLMHAAKMDFGYVPLEFFGYVPPEFSASDLPEGISPTVHALLFIAISPHVNAAFAAQLTERGCTTNLQ